MDENLFIRADAGLDKRPLRGLDMGYRRLDFS
jgi:hypothetical protein